ncbi:MAG TPA: alkaline phosphatase D family protein [Nocardioides sp.]
MSFPGAASVGAVSQAQATTLSVAGPASAGAAQIAILACSTGSETLTVPSGWALRADLTVTSPGSPDRGGTGKVWVLEQTTPSTAAQTFTKSGTRRLVGQRISWPSVTSITWPSATATSAATASNAVTAHTTASMTPAANMDVKAVAVCVIDLGPDALVTMTPPGAPWTTVTNTVTPSPAASESEIITVAEQQIAGTGSPTAFTATFTTSAVEEAFLLPLILNGTAPAASGPTVGAGADESIALGTALPTRTATENLNGGPAITSRAWTISSGPAGVGTTIGTAATLSGWTPSAAGTYVIQYAATNSNGTGTATATITVVAPSRSLLEAWLGVDAIAVKTSTNVSGEQARVAFSTSSGMTSPVYSASLVTPTAAGVSKHAVPASLAADTAHWYQVELGGVLIGAPQPFRTLPAPSGQQSFTFAFSSCRDHVDNFPSVNPTALADAVTRGIDFFLQCGDFHYRDISTNNQALFQAGYDELYTRSNIAALLKSTPTDYVWDDHDYGGDNSNGSTASRPAAQAVYRDRVPHTALPSASGGIYHTWRVGRVRFIVLDCRSFRSPNGNTDNSSKTMLGAEQKTWLQGLLNNADTPLTVIVSSVGWVGGADSAQDHWGNYSTERTEVGGWITANASKTKCVFLSGDAHMLAYDNGTNAVAGTPQYHAAALNQSTSTKGGPYSGGSRASTNAYGYVSVVDSGSQIAFTYSGYYDGGTLWQSHTTTVATVASVAAAATLGGATGLTVGGTLLRAAAATLGGTAAVQATASVDRQAGATLGGTGGLTVGATPIRPGAAVLGGSGDLTATASRGQSIEASLGGTLGLSAIPGVSGAATLGGTAGLTVGARQTHAVAAQLGGAAGLTATAFTTQRIAATLGGVAGLAVDGRRAQPIATQLGGVATLLVGGTRVHPAASTLGGTAGLTVSGIRAAAAATTLGGTLGLIAAVAAAGGGQLNISVWGVDRGNGGRLVPLPDYVKLALSDIENAVGAISLEYPARGKNFALLDQYVSNTSDLEVEIWLGGKASTAWRGYLNQREGDDVAETAFARFTGALMPQRFAETVIEPQAGNEKKELVVTAVTPGALALTLLAQAQARGALTDITVDFTTTHDSNGTPWPEVVNGKWSSSKTTYLQVLQKLATLGLAEFELTAGKVWRMYVFGGRGQNRTVGRPVTFRRGRNLTEATRRAGSRDGGTTVFVDGSEGLFTRVSNPTALAQRGRVVEVSASAGNIVEQGALNAAAQKLAARLNAGIDERSYGLTFGVGHPRPAVHFGVGDLVQAETAGVLRNERVAQIQIDVDAGGPSGSAVTGDLIADRAAALAARLNEQANGGVTVGTSTATPADDTMPPAAPTGLVVGSNIAYQVPEHTNTLAELIIGWGEVTTNADGTPAEDVDSYRVQYTYLGAAQVGTILDPGPGYDPGPLHWIEPSGSPVRDLSLRFGEVEAGVAVAVRVAAIDRSGNQSAWSASLEITTASDDTPAPVPAAPTLSVWFRTIDITSNGLGSAGEAMPSDWDHNEVWLSQAASPTLPATASEPVAFNPATTGAQHVANLYSAGTWNQPDIPIGVGWYAVLRSVDRSGNVSAPSAVAGPVTAEQLVQIDIGPNAVGQQQIIDLEVVRGKIANLAVNSAKVEELQAGLITTGTLTATVTNSGLIRTAATGNRLEFSNAGMRLYQGAGAGTLVGQWNTADASMLMTGTFRTALSGERLELLPDGTFRLYPAAGTNYNAIYNEGGGGLIFRSGFDGSNRAGFLYLRSNSAQISYGTPGTLIASSRLQCSVDASELWGGQIVYRADRNFGTINRHTFTQFSGNADIFNTVLYLRDTGGTGQFPWFHSIGGNSGWIFGPNYMAAVNNDALLIEVRASNVASPSSRRLKQREKAIGWARAGRTEQVTALDVVRGAKAKEWEYLHEAKGTRPARPGKNQRRVTDERGRPLRDADGREIFEEVDAEWSWEEQPAPKHYGPMAEDLEVLAPDLVRRDPEDPSMVFTDVRDLLGVLWKAVDELADQLDTRVGPRTIRP